jgi:KDO2-lipid IV(A) lauroyltransferase
MKDRPFRHRLEYGLYQVFKTFLRTLPHATARSFGRGLGSFAHALDRRHREIARRNMALALPEIGAAERDRLVRECFRHFGAALCDAVSSSRFDEVEICRRFTLEGWEHVEAAEALGRGLFFLTAHLGFWELAPPVLGLYRGAVGIVVRPADNPWLDRELTGLRARFGNFVLPKRGAARKMLETIRRGGRVGLLIDQRVQAKEGIETTFFGHAALTSPILARMSSPRAVIASSPVPPSCRRKAPWTTSPRSPLSPSAISPSPRRTSAPIRRCGCGCTGGGTGCVEGVMLPGQETEYDRADSNC